MTCHAMSITTIVQCEPTTITHLMNIWSNIAQWKPGLRTNEGSIEYFLVFLFENFVRRELW